MLFSTLLRLLILFESVGQMSTGDVFLSQQKLYKNKNKINLQILLFMRPAIFLIYLRVGRPVFALFSVDPNTTYTHSS